VLRAFDRLAFLLPLESLFKRILVATNSELKTPHITANLGAHKPLARLGCRSVHAKSDFREAERGVSALLHTAEPSARPHSEGQRQGLRHIRVGEGGGRCVTRKGEFFGEGCLELWAEVGDGMKG
jgi:hypothetical protein